MSWIGKFSPLQQNIILQSLDNDVPFQTVSRLYVGSCHYDGMTSVSRESEKALNSLIANINSFHLEKARTTLNEKICSTLPPKLFACLLVQGTNSSTESIYAYLMIQMLRLASLLKYISTNRFNPKDLNGIVLAKGKGEPALHVQAYMNLHFHFSSEPANSA